MILMDIALIIPGKLAGLSGAIAGGAQPFFDKNKARSLEGKLEK